MIRNTSTDFDGISNDLPDVNDVTSEHHQKIIIKNRFFIFAPETFLGHLGGVGRLYLEDLY